MSTQDLKTRLYNMVGKTYIYAGKILLVQGIDVNTVEEEIFIDTDKGFYRSAIAKADTFLNLWQLTDAAPVEVPAPANNALALHPEVKTMDTTAEYLINEMKEVISKVKQDADYAPQAKAINAAVNSIINVKRTQLEMYKAVSGKK